MEDWRLSLRIALFSVAWGAMVGALAASIVEAPNRAAISPTASTTLPATTRELAIDSAAATVVAGAFEIGWSMPISSETTASAPMRPSEASQEEVAPETSPESVPARIDPADPQATGEVKQEQPPKALPEDKTISERGPRTAGRRMKADDGRNPRPGSGEWGW